MGNLNPITQLPYYLSKLTVLNMTSILKRSIKKLVQIKLVPRLEQKVLANDKKTFCVQNL